MNKNGKILSKFVNGKFKKLNINSDQKQYMYSNKLDNVTEEAPQSCNSMQSKQIRLILDKDSESQISKLIEDEANKKE